MTTYKRIVCTLQVPFGNPPLCARIISVGASSGGEIGEEELKVADVIRQMDQGIVFYTKGLESGKTALVQKYWCANCGRYHIRSAADAVKDNNLDYLRYCNWQKAA